MKPRGTAPANRQGGGAGHVEEGRAIGASSRKRFEDVTFNRRHDAGKPGSVAGVWRGLTLRLPVLPMSTCGGTQLDAPCAVAPAPARRGWSCARSFRRTLLSGPATSVPQSVRSASWCGFVVEEHIHREIACQADPAAPCWRLHGGGASGCRPGIGQRHAGVPGEPGPSPGAPRVSKYVSWLFRANVNGTLASAASSRRARSPGSGPGRQA